MIRRETITCQCENGIIVSADLSSDPEVHRFSIRFEGESERFYLTGPEMLSDLRNIQAAINCILRDADE